MPSGAFGNQGNDAVADSLRQVEAAARAEIFRQNGVDFLQQAGALPLEVIAVTGLVGGVGRRHVIPRLTGANLPEDAVQDGAPIARGTPGVRRRQGRKAGFNQPPLFVGKVHRNFE